MKFGVMTGLWEFPLDLKILAPKVAQMGFDLIEVPIMDTSPFDYARAGEITKDSGLGASVVTFMDPDRDLLDSEAAVRENGMNYLRHCIDAVRLMGGTNVCGPFYSAAFRLWQVTPEVRAKLLDLLVEQLRRVSLYAADNGAILGVEPLNRHETSFLNLSSQVVEVVDRVGSPACGLMLDSFHMNIEEASLGNAIRTAGRRLVQLHACENDRGAPGSGHLAWTEIAAALHDIQFDGPVVIESFTDQSRPLAPDALAQAGVKFLRQLLA
jgi:D-psicose/D-tagatose/L-ribulose 3-epimerase